MAPTPEVAAFVSAVYRFDRTEVTLLTADLCVPATQAGLCVPATQAGLCVPATQAGLKGWRLRVSAPDLGLALWLQAGPGWRIPFPRPSWVTRWVEAPLARRLLGVQTYGVSPTGVAEWYRADAYRPVVAGQAALAGRDLGPLGPLHPPVGFGFSEPPRRPSIVSVRPLLEDRSGALVSVLPPARLPERPRRRRGRA